MARATPPPSKSSHWLHRARSTLIFSAARTTRVSTSRPTFVPRPPNHKPRHRRATIPDTPRPTATMICRQCLRRATTLARQPARQPILTRPFSAFPALRTAAEAASTPTTAPAGEPAAKEPAVEPKSACPAGTVLVGLNYFKGKQDPVALPDEEYPDWLWRCLEFPEKAVNADDAAAAEFCKSPSPCFTRCCPRLPLFPSAPWEVREGRSMR